MASSQPRYGRHPIDYQEAADIKVNSELLAYLTGGPQSRWLQRFDNAAGKFPVFLELRLAQQHAILCVSHEYMRYQALLR